MAPSGALKLPPREEVRFVYNLAITDPRARDEAIKCRYDWQLITSQPNVIRTE